MSGQRRIDAGSEPTELGDAAPNFIGRVGFVQHVDPASDEGVAVLTVRFAAGAATAWHRHARGQYLESLEGAGWVEDGAGKRIPLPPGERIWCPPGAIHRHGASEGGDWLQFSITPGPTEWGEDPDPVAVQAEEE